MDRLIEVLHSHVWDNAQIKGANKPDQADSEQLDNPLLENMNEDNNDSLHIISDDISVGEKRGLADSEETQHFDIAKWEGMLREMIELKNSRPSSKNDKATQYKHDEHNANDRDPSDMTKEHLDRRERAARLAMMLAAEI